MNVSISATQRRRPARRVSGSGCTADGALLKSITSKVASFFEVTFLFAISSHFRTNLAAIVVGGFSDVAI